jgi:hypothetical protein
VTSQSVRTLILPRYAGDIYGLGPWTYSEMAEARRVALPPASWEKEERAVPMVELHHEH